MVRKRDQNAPVADAICAEARRCRFAGCFRERMDFSKFDTAASGSTHLWDDYEPGEKIDHVDGMTVEEAEHMMATRLYQNTARVHFNQFTEGKGRFGRRLIYGGHVISLARALSFNGLGECGEDRRHQWRAARQSAVRGRHRVCVVASARQGGNLPEDCGALRLRLVATKNLPCADFPDKNAEGEFPDNVILDFDYWALAPRRTLMLVSNRAASRWRIETRCRAGSAAERLQTLANALKHYRPGKRWFFTAKPAARPLHLGRCGARQIHADGSVLRGGASRQKAPRAFQRLHGGNPCAHPRRAPERRRRRSDRRRSRAQSPMTQRFSASTNSR